MVDSSLTFTDFFPEIVFDEDFAEYFIRKLKDKERKTIIKNQIKKIICSPERQKHMQYDRKGQIEVYIPPQRLYYSYSKEEEIIYFIEISHKKKQ